MSYRSIHSAAQTQAAPAVGTDGYIHGIDGLLNQISGALVRQAKTEILPTLQSDTAFQRTVGSAVGAEIAKPLWFLFGVAAIYAGWKMTRPQRSSR